MNEYRIGELAHMAGITTRTLRFYEEVGLLAPSGRSERGYRLYCSADADRLQEILLLRRCGVAVREIGPLLSTTPAERADLLARHLGRLRDERLRLTRLIATVERTLATLEGAGSMTDIEKFEGFKRNLVDKNEKRYGAEVRERYGDDVADESNRKMLRMSKQEYADFRTLEEQIRSELERAVDAGDDPAGETGERICSMHRTWLGYTWPAYSAEAHRGLAESYVADNRFRSYYDRSVEGCAAWLRDAIVTHAR